MPLRRTSLVVVTALALACAREPGSGDEAGEQPASESESTTDATTTESESASDAESSGETDTSNESDTASDTGAPLEGYDDPALWLCHPDKALADDACRSADLRATAIAADGSTSILEHELALDPSFDCFYVYPTVDLRLSPGQTENFDDLAQELDPLLMQAAPFTAQCRMFAPLYHQVTLGTFASAEAETLLDAAYADVEAAFASFLALSGERPMLILGHSQGTFMTTRLIRDHVESDPVLRERLIAALLIGGSVSVPPGELVGGTFASLPLCESAEQNQCVIAFRTYASELPPGPGDQSSDAPGLRVACTDPSALLGHDKLAASTFARQTAQPAAFVPVDPGIAVDTPFVRYDALFAATCELDVDGNAYLSISFAPEPGDQRDNPIDFGLPVLSPSILGLHVFDYQFPLGELLELVAIKAAAH